MNRLHNDYVDKVFLGNFAKIYGLIVESIEKTADKPLLAELYNQINNSGQSLSLPLAESEEIVRMFIRLGVLESKNQVDLNRSIIQFFVENLATEADRSPALTSVIIRLFASGQYGIISTPICGSAPQCSKCRLTKLCKFFNSPPADPAGTKLSPLKRLELGADHNVSNIELISLLIGGNRPNSSHINAAKNLLSRFRTLRTLSNVPLAELKSLRDVGETAAVRIYSALVLYRRFAKEENFEKIVIKESKDLYDLYKIELRDQKQEGFYIVMLDNMNGIIKQEKIALGGLTTVQVISREVFTPALKESASAVALIHNHPSGNPKPSRDDMKLTFDLVKAGELLDIKVVDHVIIGDNKYVSFVDDNIAPFKGLTHI